MRASPVLRAPGLVLLLLLGVSAVTACSSENGDGEEGSTPDPMAAGSHAKSPVWTIGEDPRGSCAVELERLPTLGSVDDLHLYHGFSTVVQGPGPSYYLSGGFTPGAILRYDARGAFQGTIGRLGGGPGEVPPHAEIAVTPQDSLLVSGEGRIRIFSSETGEFVRSLRTEPPFWALAPLSDGGIVGWVGPNPEMETVRVLDPDGSLRFSVRFDGTLEHQDQLWQRAHETRGANILVSDAGRYRLRAFDRNGGLAWTLERKAEWFPSYARQPSGASLLVPSLPEVISAWIDSEQRLWVLLERAAEPFHPLDQAPAAPELRDVSSQFDSYIEVIDLKTRVLLGAGRTNWLRPVTGGGGVLHSSETDAEGFVRFTLWRPYLVC